MPPPPLNLTSGSLKKQVGLGLGVAEGCISSQQLRRITLPSTHSHPYWHPHTQGQLQAGVVVGVVWTIPKVMTAFFLFLLLWLLFPYVCLRPKTSEGVSQTTTHLGGQGWRRGE